MRLKHNLFSGVAASAWSAVVSLLVVPLYLRYLGIEAYGLIGFFATLQSLFTLLDLGLGPTISREIARAAVDGTMDEARDLLHTLAVVYWTTAAAITLVMIGCASLIARYWLSPEHLSLHTVTTAIMWMGVVIACRWPAALYMGALMGKEHMVGANALNILNIGFSNIGAVVILAFVSPTVNAFFAWQALIGLLYAFGIQRLAWHHIGARKKFHFDAKVFQRIWRFSGGMAAVALSGVIFSQLDKIVLAKVLPLDEFGRYALATTVASVLYRFIIPVFNVLYPRFSSLIAADDIPGLSRLYCLGTNVFSTVLFPVTMMMGVFAEPAVRLWTGNPLLAAQVAPLIKIIAIGTALHGVMYFQYALQLSYGLPRLALTINLVLMTVLVPLILVLAIKYGAYGGAIAWLVLHFLYIAVGTWMTHRRVLQDIALKWLNEGLVLPIVATALVGVGGVYVARTGIATIPKLAIGLVLGVVAVFLCRLISPYSWEETKAELHR